MLEQKNEAVNIIFPRNSSWVILSPIEQRIKEKIEKVGVPLKDWDIQINYGIKTGCNEAFIIDKTKRDELIKQSPNSVDIIRPILRGRDIKRYSYDFADTYLLNVHNGIREKDIPPINIDDYLAVKAHLDHYWDKIAVRDDRGKTPYNLRNCAYMDDFNKQKIIYPCIMADEPKFCLDKTGEYFTVAPGNIITGKNTEYLLNMLCSNLLYFALRKFYMGGGIEGELKTNRLKLLPIVLFDESNKICKKLKNLFTNNNEIDNLVYQLYGLTENEINYIRNNFNC